MSEINAASRANWKPVSILLLAAAVVAALLPAGLASGDEGVVAPGGIIYLAMGKSPSSDVITFDDLEQSIPTKKSDCTAVDALNPGGAESILVVEEIQALSLGESKDHIGTQGPGDGAGEPCALAAAGAGNGGADEGISVKLGNAVGEEISMSGFSIDIRLKAAGAVKATTYLGGVLVDEEIPVYTFEGPDNKPDSADNFRWTYDGGESYFDEVRFVAVAGAFALGGGVESDDAGDFDSSSFASQFQTVREFDGELDCSPLFADIGDPSVDTTYGQVTMHSQNNDGAGWITSGCTLKPYDAETAAAAISYVPELSNVEARYTLDVTVESQAITVDTDSSNTVPDGTITSLTAEYDPTGDLSFPVSSTTPLLQCNGQPILSGVHYDTFWNQATLYVLDSTGTPTSVVIMPAGETACFYSASVTPTLPGFGTELWSILFFEDPGFGFK